MERFFAVAVLVVVPTYLLWRLTFTMNPQWPVASGLMILADALLGLSAVGFALARLRGDGATPEALPPEPGLSVDVWIPTYNEDLALLRRTVHHALRMDYPHTTYVLDDGAREDVRVMCEELGARYIARRERAHGKAGNLNHALGLTQGDLIATFDADFVPQRDFLTRLLGHFKNPKVALVQTPQQYYNLDSFQHHRRRSAIWDEQETFFDVTMPGLAAWESVYWVGTNAILRREAIADIGGFPTDSLIEDMLTGMSLHDRGYESIYVNEKLAHGLAPAFASQFLTQRLRWAQGAFQILRRHNPLFKRGLSPMQRALYFSGLLHFADGLPRLIFYALPALFILFGVAPLQLTPGVALGIGAYVLFSLTAPWVLSRGKLRLLRGELFAMIRFFPYLRGMLAFLALKPLRFVVTPKSGSEDKNALEAWHLAGPAAVLALNLGAALVGLSMLRFFSIDGLSAADVALAVCALFCLAYVLLAGWAIRWSFTRPSAEGLAALEPQPVELGDEPAPTAARHRPRRLDFARYAAVTLMVMAMALAAGTSLTPAGLRPAWVRDGLRLTAKGGRSLVTLTQPAATYSTRGRAIIGPDGEPLPTLKGISWFGFETDTYVPHGLWARPMDTMLDHVKALGFNMIRVPYSTATLHTTLANSVAFAHNPDLVGLTPIEVMDELVERAAARGLYILLDHHSLDHRDHRLEDLWYNDEFPEEVMIADWEMLARRYRGIPEILGADIHNEPKGVATWGSGDEATDWRLAAERIGDAILAVNPDWLIFVEGVTAPDGCDPNGPGDLRECYWDGGNLSAVREHPVRLSVENKVVYTPHVYGPGLFHQPWHDDLWFPANLASIWSEKWAFIHEEGIAPVLVGEFGGPGIDDETLDGLWKQAIVAFIEENDLSWSYWTLNPNSPDTKGLLEDDWATVNRGRYYALAPLLLDDEDDTPSNEAEGEKTPAPMLCMKAP